MWWESPSEPLALVPSGSLHFVTSLKESPYSLTVSSGPIDGAGCEVRYREDLICAVTIFTIQRKQDILGNASSVGLLLTRLVYYFLAIWRWISTRNSWPSSTVSILPQFWRI